MANDSSIFRPFITFFVLLFIVFIIVFAYFNQSTGSNYRSNEFIVSINNVKLKYAYRERFNNKISKEGFDFGNDYQDILIYKENIMLLNFEEYEAYDKNSFKVNGGFNNSISSKKYTYKAVNNNPKIKIKKNGKTLYDGNYISDISNYLQENGRYYLHIYIERKENSATVKTDLSMTFLITDKEKKND